MTPRPKPMVRRRPTPDRDPWIARGYHRLPLALVFGFLGVIIVISVLSGLADARS